LTVTALAEAASRRRAPRAAAAQQHTGAGAQVTRTPRARTLHYNMVNSRASRATAQTHAATPPLLRSYPPRCDVISISRILYIWVLKRCDAYACWHHLNALVNNSLVALAAAQHRKKQTCCGTADRHSAANYTAPYRRRKRRSSNSRRR